MLSNKWAALIIVALRGGELRFSALKRTLDGITQKSLTQGLRHLERDGLITRTVYPTIPPRVDYALTDLGRSVSGLLDAIKIWSERNLPKSSRPAPPTTPEPPSPSPLTPNGAPATMRRIVGDVPVGVLGGSGTLGADTRESLDGTPARPHPLGPQKMFVVAMRVRGRPVPQQARGHPRMHAAVGRQVETFEKPPLEGLADDMDTFWRTGGTFRRMWDELAEARKQRLIPSEFRPLGGEAGRGRDGDLPYGPVLIQAEEPSPSEWTQAVLDKGEPPWLFLSIHEAVIRNLHAEVACRSANACWI